MANLNAGNLNAGNLNSDNGIYVPPAPAENTWPLSLAVTDFTTAPEFGLSLSVFGVMTPEFGLSLAVVDRDAIINSDEHAWSRKVVLSGADVSARMIGSSNIDAEANAAAVAQISLMATAGTFDPNDYQGAEIQLFYVWIDPVGSVQYSIQQFIGLVDTVSLSVATGIITLICSDRRKGLLLGADKPTIDAMLPGSLWSDGVFEADVDGLRYATDRLSTMCADFDVQADGAPVVTPWAAKFTPDWIIDRCIDGTLECEFARNSDLVQRVSIQFDYRFSRLRQREARIGYEFDFNDLFDHAIAPPSSANFEAALAATGWIVLAAPTYDRPLPWYAHGGGYLIVDADNGITRASARIGKRFVQSVDERYTLTVSSASSGIDARLSATLSGALEAPFDAAVWEVDNAVAPILPAPGWAIESTADATTDSTYGRAGAENAIRTLLAIATAMIRASHRSSSISFSVPLNPFITRADTLSINVGALSAIGKVARVRHNLDPANGEARTTVTVAISRPGLINPSATDAHTPPAAPGVPVPDPAVIAAHSMRLGNHVGGLEYSPPFDEDWSGYIVNVPSESRVDGSLLHWSEMALTTRGASYGNGEAASYASVYSEEPASKYSGSVINPSFDASTVYAQQFRIIAPGVEAAARDNVSTDIAADYLVRIPQDALSIEY